MRTVEAECPHPAGSHQRKAGCRDEGPALAEVDGGQGAGHPPARRAHARWCETVGLVLALAAIGAWPSGMAAESRLADAAERNDWPAVRALLEQRAGVNAAQIDGMTALHWAAQHEAPAMARLLLEAGAAADAANRYGVTPLSVACTNGNAALVAALLGAGADP
ncbi:MAG: ankyrin repeat domain-containing protein, partial [Verrucomicrobia bacterium]|nr:ankyrin repeat domain-containing protein [Verrucomicrobiota bacterium]